MCVSHDWPCPANQKPCMWSCKADILWILATSYGFVLDVIRSLPFQFWKLTSLVDIYVFHWCLRAHSSHLTDFHARTHLPFYGMEPWLCLSNIIPNWHYKDKEFTAQALLKFWRYLFWRVEKKTKQEGKNLRAYCPLKEQCSRAS